MAMFEVTAVLMNGKTVKETYDSYDAATAEEEVDIYIPDVDFVESVEEI